jgi:hypothetical protein
MTVPLSEALKKTTASILLLVLILPAAVVADKEAGLPAVKINDRIITLGEYSDAWRRTIQQKYYHGKVPEGGIVALRKEVGEELVDRYLLSWEALRRGFQPDQTSISKELTSYDNRYAKADEWQKRREELLPALRAQLEMDDLINQLRTRVTSVEEPAGPMVQAYYEKHPEKFTIPPQLDVSVILLRVAPSSPPEAWIQTREKALDMVKGIRGGESFEQLARLHSDDPSAKAGGHLGNIHLGMLVEDAQRAIDQLEPGAITAPVLLLEGLGIFRLNAQIPSRKMPFETVAERAGKLLTRELGESAWEELISSLRGESDITYYEENYLPSS